MDKLNIGVLRELLVDDSTLTIHSDVRRPYLTIAKKLQVTEDTVRSRILKMQRAGLIRGWRLGLNPTLFDYQAEFVWVDVNPPATKGSVIRMVRKNPHAILIQNFFDNSIGIGLAYGKREELDKEITEIKRISNSQNILTAKTPSLPCSLRLTDMDWCIVKSIRQDPRKPYRKVANELGLSRRMVERRTVRMIGAGALFVLPELDLSKLDGGLLASLDIFYPPELKRQIDRQIITRYGELLLIMNSTAPGFGWFVFLAPNPAVAKEIQSWVASLEGVRTAQLRVIEEFINLLGEAFEQELQKGPLSVRGRA